MWSKWSKRTLEDVYERPGTVDGPVEAWRPRLALPSLRIPVLTGIGTASALPWRWLFGSRLLVLLAGVGSAIVVPARGGFRIPSIADHLGTVGNVLGASVVRWDSTYYLAIASHGYTTGRADLAVFFPLYPLLIHIVGFVTRSDVVAGAAISLASFAIAMALLHRLTEREFDKRTADITVLLVAFAPLSFFFSALYTESLFLALSLAAILAARNERWAAAGIFGGLATLTRVTGILLVVPIVIMHRRSRRRLDPQLGWAALMPLALIAYVGFLAMNGISWLAPFADEKSWGRVTVGPIVGIASAAWVALKSAAAILQGHQAIYDPTRYGPLTPSAESIFLLLVLVVAFIVLASCFRRLPLEYGAYAAVALLMCVSSPRVGQPLVSFDRYLLTIFPLWMAAGAWIARRQLAHLVIPAGALLLVFYTVQFSSWSFVA